MLSENQSTLLYSLYEERVNIQEMIMDCELNILAHKERLRMVESAIINLETGQEIE